MSKIIKVEISDSAYEELLEKAKEIQKIAIDLRGNEFTMSAHDIICHAAELGIMPHIERHLDIFEDNFDKKRCAE